MERALKATGTAGLVVLLGLGACGSGQRAGGPSTGAGSGQDDGGTGGGGQGGGTNPIAGLDLVAEPWFLSVPPQSAAAMVLFGQSDGMGGPTVLHVAVPNATVGFTVSTHHHFDVFGFARTISFSARRSEAGPLRVSLQRRLSSLDYFADAAAGGPWPSTVVETGTEWQAFEVQISDLSPPEPPADLPPGFMLSFVVQATQPSDLDLKDVHIR